MEEVDLVDAPPHPLLKSMVTVMVTVTVTVTAMEDPLGHAHHAHYQSTTSQSVRLDG